MKIWIICIIKKIELNKSHGQLNGKNKIRFLIENLKMDISF